MCVCVLERVGGWVGGGWWENGKWAPLPKSSTTPYLSHRSDRLVEYPQVSGAFAIHGLRMRSEIAIMRAQVIKCQYGMNRTDDKAVGPKISSKKRKHSDAPSHIPIR